jgi:hypothetical protein
VPLPVARTMLRVWRSAGALPCWGAQVACPRLVRCRHTFVTFISSSGGHGWRCVCYGSLYERTKFAAWARKTVKRDTA